jgi:hypothetical protein
LAGRAPDRIQDIRQFAQELRAQHQAAGSLEQAYAEDVLDPLDGASRSSTRRLRWATFNY